VDSDVKVAPQLQDDEPDGDDEASVPAADAAPVSKHADAIPDDGDDDRLLFPLSVPLSAAVSVYSSSSHSASSSVPEPVDIGNDEKSQAVDDHGSYDDGSTDADSDEDVMEVEEGGFLHVIGDSKQKWIGKIEKIVYMERGYEWDDENVREDVTIGASVSRMSYTAINAGRVLLLVSWYMQKHSKSSKQKTVRKKEEWCPEGNDDVIDGSSVIESFSCLDDAVAAV
jgi:hypothetical protein